MFFVQCDARIQGKTYTIRVGKMTTNWDEAKRKAIKRKGYIVNESRRLVGQAMDAGAPYYVGELKNISSGEDSYANA
jgi:hypothetical protein